MTYLKNLKALFLFVMFAAVIVSCNKEEIDTENTDPGEIEVVAQTEQNPLLLRSTTSETGLDLDCFTILYSFSVLDSVGNSYEITSDQDFQDLTNDGIYVVDFVYPLTVEFEDGETQEVENGQELGEAFANCLPNGWDEGEFPAYLINEDNSCYTFVYPVTLVDEEGNTTTTNNDEEFIEAISEEIQFFSFPLTITGPDGEVTVSNSDQLFAAIVDCNSIDIDSTWYQLGTPTIACYELQFPFNFLMLDGTTESVDSESDYFDLLFQGNVAGFGYPLTLIGANGNTVINSDDDLNDALLECSNVLTFDLITLYSFAIAPDSTSGEVCFDINFPLDVNEVSSTDGSIVNTVTVNSLADFELIPGINEGWVFQLPVYPFSVTLTSSGEVVQVASVSDLFNLIENCN